MMTVVGCIVEQHNLWLVLLAAVICGSGSWAMVRLFLRAADARSTERLAWIVLTAFVTGASIWCTHFVAMLGYEPGIPIAFDPVLTIVSLLVAMVGSGAGFLVATGMRSTSQLLGGAIVGLAIVVMHYTGMMAYRVEGIVSWDNRYLVASIVISCVLSSTSLVAALRGGGSSIRPHVATGLFFLSIIGLHFTGMTAFRVSPMHMDGTFSDPEALKALAFAVSCVGLLIVAAGFASSFIDNRARATAADALANMTNGLTMLSAAGVVTLVNERVATLFGVEPGVLRPGLILEDYVAIIGRRVGWDEARVERVVNNHRTWMAAAGPTHVEHHFDNGLVLEISCQPVGRGGAILTYQDVTEARNGQKTIAHMAFHDTLTGLKNRRMFNQSIAQLLNCGDVTMLMIDLDRFKEVNDRYGHAVGDLLLQQVSARIESVLRTGEPSFRLGGDELAILCNDEGERAGMLAGELVAMLSTPFEIGPHLVTIGCSIGIATAKRYEDTSILQRKADLALYAAKKGGRARHEFYMDGMIEEEARRRAFEQDLLAAVERDELELWYQPLFSFSDEKKLVGFEALLRWRHPVHGLVPPAEFIPVAEASGLVNAIGRWVIEEACRRAALWPSHLYMSINVSAIQLRSALLSSQLDQALSRNGLSASRVELEITETAIVEHSDQLAVVLAGIRALGVRVAMDDFGTGYSSLAHLREFKVDRIKIDRSFIASFTTDPGTSAIVRAVISMARELGIETTAEGIETEAQFEGLRALGCGTAQGYLLGRPMEAAKADALVMAAVPGWNRAVA